MKNYPLSATATDLNEANTHSHDISTAEGTVLLTQAREGVLEDGLLTRDEENALNRRTNHFHLKRDQLKRNDILTRLVKPTALRHIAGDFVPQRQNITGHVPFNLMMPKKSVWQRRTPRATRPRPSEHVGATPRGSVPASNDEKTPPKPPRKQLSTPT